MACFKPFLIEPDAGAISLETTDKIMDLVFSVITGHVLEIGNYTRVNIKKTDIFLNTRYYCNSLAVTSIQPK